jgi:hypothetical protein
MNWNVQDKSLSRIYSLYPQIFGGWLFFNKFDYSSYSKHYVINHIVVKIKKWFLIRWIDRLGVQKIKCQIFRDRGSTSFISIYVMEEWFDVCLFLCETVCLENKFTATKRNNGDAPKQRMETHSVRVFDVASRITK